MNVLSLFNGVSCGKLALERAGINVSNYYASEVDKYAIDISKRNHGESITQLGDVKKLEFSASDQIDLLIGGSPCQGFSFAGKQLNFSDKKSVLFFEYVRALKTIKPKYFLLENVLMKKEYQEIISDQLGVRPIKINSALVSAQNRNRLYWTNIPNVTIPEDRGIGIKDILEDDGMPFNYSSSGRGNGKVEGRFSVSDKALTLTATGYTNRATTAVFATVASSKNRVVKQAGDKAACLVASLYKGIRPAGGPFILSSDKIGLHLDDLVKDRDYRMLTPLECERLQTLPDNYTQGVSNTQRYKMIGNGWTVDVIAHILKGIKQ